MTTAFRRRDTDQISTAFRLHVDSGRIDETFKSSCSKSSQVCRRCKPRVTRYSPQHKRDLRKAMPQCTRSLAPTKLTLPRAAVYLCRFHEIYHLACQFFYNNNNPLCDSSYTLSGMSKENLKKAKEIVFETDQNKSHISRFKALKMRCNRCGDSSYFPSTATMPKICIYIY